MTRLDVNGNVTARDMQTLPTSILEGTYSTDGYGRIMVKTIDGGMVVFFENERPSLADRVRHLLKKGGAQ